MDIKNILTPIIKKENNLDEKMTRKKKRYFGCLVVILLPIIILIVYALYAHLNTDNSSNNKPSVEVTTKENWKNKEISFKDGNFKIKRIFKVKAYTFGSELVPGLFVIGKFTNKSTQPEEATDFMNNHMQVSAIGPKTKTELMPSSYKYSPKYKTLLKNSGKKVLPNKTVKCAVNFLGGHIGKDIPNKFKITITNNKDNIYTTTLSNFKVETLNETYNNASK